MCKKYHSFLDFYSGLSGENLVVFPPDDARLNVWEGSRNYLWVVSGRHTYMKSESARK